MYGMYFWYNCVKYRNSPYYKGSLLWDSLPPGIKENITLLDFKKSLRIVYQTYNNVMS